MTETALHISAAHPAFAGHFPGHPVVPGVVLLDEVIRAIESHAGRDFVLRYQLASVKFLKPVAPQARLRILVDFKPDSQIAFAVSEAGRPVASGSFTPVTQG